MSNSPWDEQIAIRVTPPMQPRRPRWPWEQPDRIQRHRDFLREYICEVYLVRVFDETARYVGRYGQGFNFICDNGATFAIRASCLAPTNRSWVCNFGNTEADFILFFGFRDRENPSLEFCLILPLSRFRDRDKITIQDDGYHIKGYREFWISDEKLAEMQTVMDAIRRQDSEVLERYLPRQLR
jgi:hypothetical protein